MKRLITTSVIAVALSAAVSSSAFAQSPEDQAAAQALFDEGQRLMRAEKFEEACKKLEASLGLLPGLGTRGKLAQCYEKLGKTASAWAAFRHVATLAKKQGDTKRYQAAQAYVDRLATELSFVTFTAAEAVPGMELLRDDVAISIGALGTPIAVDPGEHRIEVRAPGYAPWQSTIEVGKETKLSVEIPALEKLDLEVSGGAGDVGSGGTLQSPMSPPPPDSSMTGKILVGAGGVLVGGAVALALVGDSKWTGAFDNGDCDEATNICNAAGKSATDSARTLSTVSLALGTVGIVTAAAGTYFWLRSGDENSSGISLAPTITAAGGGIALGGRF